MHGLATARAIGSSDPVRPPIDFPTMGGEPAVGEKPGLHQRGRVRSVDGLRALAFTLVFLFHSWEFSGRPRVPVITDIVAQNTRPDLFVVLTGFALYLPFAIDPGRHERFRTGNYLERRVKRIVLPYYAALALAIALPYVLKFMYSVVGRSTSTTVPPDIGDVISHLTFTHMFFPQYWAGINGSLWTMSLEMQLYLLFPLLILAVARWGVRAMVPLALASVSWHLLSPFDGQWPHNFLWGATAVGRLTEFMAGMLAATLVMRHRKLLTGRWLALAATLFLAGYAVAVNLADSTSLPLRELGLSLAFGALIVLAIAVPPVERFFGSGPVSRLGYMAYSMFLVHQPIAWYMSEALTKVLGLGDGLTKLVVMWTLGFGAVLVVGGVFFVLVEEPCIRWSKAVKKPGSRDEQATQPAPEA